MKSLNKLGLKFAIFSAIVSILSFLASYWPQQFGKLTGWLAYSGGIIPFVSGLSLRNLGGCELKDPGCTPFFIIGFILGSIALAAIYYAAGALISKLLKKNKVIKSPRDY